MPCTIQGELAFRKGNIILHLSAQRGSSFSVSRTRQLIQTTYNPSFKKKSPPRCRPFPQFFTTARRAKEWLSRVWQTVEGCVLYHYIHTYIRKGAFYGMVLNLLATKLHTYVERTHFLWLSKNLWYQNMSISFVFSEKLDCKKFLIFLFTNFGIFLRPSSLKILNVFLTKNSRIRDWMK